jgi:hypothetical protein
MPNGTSSSVAPQWQYWPRFARQSWNDTENRIADPLRLLPELLKVDIFYLRLFGDLGCCFGRDDAEIGLSSRERCFDICLGRSKRVL